MNSLTKQKLKLKSNAYCSLLKLITIQFWRNIHTVFFVYIFPIIFIAVWGYLSMDYMMQNSVPGFMSSIIGILTFQIVSSGIQQIPSAIMEFKNSVLLKRIGATPIKPIDFILNVVLVYFSFIVFQIFWIVLWTTLIFGFHKFSNGQTGIDAMFYGNVQWGGFFISEIYIVLLACILGVFISSISKTATQATALSMAFFFITMLLSGQLVPIPAIDNNEFFNVVSWMTPFRYGNQLAWMSWNGVDIFNCHAWNTEVEINPSGLVPPYHVKIWMGWVSWFMPLAYMSIFVGFSIFKFKWYVR